MVCNKCGAVIPDRAKFCVKCGNKMGAPLPEAPAVQGGKNCRKCGAPLKEDAMFCISCGAKVNEAEQEVFGGNGAEVNDGNDLQVQAGNMPVKQEDEVSVNADEQHNEESFENQPEEISETPFEEEISDEMSESRSEEQPEEVSEIQSEETSDITSDEVLKAQSEEISETLSEEVSGERTDVETDLQSQRKYKLLDIKIDDSKDIKVLHKRAFVYLEDEKYDEAYTYFEHFLDNDPEDAVAFYGRLMLELGFKSEEEFETLDKDIKDNKNFKRAYKYGDDLLREKLDKYAGNAAYSIFTKKLDELDSIEDIEKLKSEIEDNEPGKERMYAACDKKRDAVLEEGYQQALELKNKIQTAKQAKQACLKFKSLGDYKDAPIYSNECAGIEARIISEQQQKQQNAAHIKNNFSSDDAEKTMVPGSWNTSGAQNSNAQIPDMPRPNGQVSNMHNPNAPRPNGQVSNMPNPNAPRSNGQVSNMHNPNAPRPNGQAPNMPNPNAPRPNGHVSNMPNSNAPRPNGQAPNMPNPNAPRPNGQVPNAKKKNPKKSNQPANINNGQNPTAAVKGEKKSNKPLIIILITAIVLLIAVGTAAFFVFRAMNDFDEEKAKNGYFDFLPDMTIGEILDATHKNPEGENEDSEEPVWSKSTALSGCTVEFKGENVYDDTSVLIRFAKGNGENPEIKYAEIDGKKADIVALEVYIEDIYDKYSGNVSEPKVTDSGAVQTTAKAETTIKTTTVTLSAEQLSEQKSLDYVGKCISDIKSEYGEPDTITSKTDGARIYGIYKYGNLGFEYVKEDSSDTPSELMITNDTIICGAYFDQSSYISENYHVGMTYKELAGLIVFEKNVPEYDDAEGKMIAKGNVKGKKYSAKVIFEDVAGMKSGTKGTADQKSQSVYIHDKDIADVYVNSYREAAKKAVKKDNAFKGTIKLDDGYLNVRETPSMNGKIIGKLYKNDEVTVEEVSGEWYKITKGDLKGYISGEYLECALKKYLETAYNSYKTYGDSNVIAFYDIDKDGTTEMILEEGTCEADSVYQIYTVAGSQVKYAGSASASNATLYESDDGKLVTQMIHTGYEVVKRVELINGSVVETELYSASSEIDEYSNPGTAIKVKKLGEIFGN